MNFQVKVLLAALSLLCVSPVAASAFDWPDYSIPLTSNAVLEDATDVLDSKNYRQAIRLFQNVVQTGISGTQLASVRNAQCVAATKLDKLDDAMEYCDDALAHDSSYWMALINKGNILDAQDNRADAIKAWCQAYALAPENVFGTAIKACK